MKKSDKTLLAEISRWATLNERKPSSLAKLICIKERTFYRRKTDPGTFTLEELRSIVKVTKASDETILKIVKG